MQFSRWLFADTFCAAVDFPQSPKRTFLWIVWDLTCVHVDVFHFVRRWLIQFMLSLFALPLSLSLFFMLPEPSPINGQSFFCAISSSSSDNQLQKPERLKSSFAPFHPSFSLFCRSWWWLFCDVTFLWSKGYISAKRRWIAVKFTRTAASLSVTTCNAQ